MKRRSLLGGLEPPPSATVPAEAITEAAARHGFAVPQPASVGEPSVRRRRQPTGRIHQFNVRLRAETLEAIYAEANGRNVPVAQVIEEAMAALARQGGG